MRMEPIEKRRTPSITWHWIPVALWMGIILFFTLYNVNTLHNTYGFLFKLFRILRLPEMAPAKLFHFFAYAVLFLLEAGAIRRQYFSRLTRLQAGFILLSVIAFGALQEGLQFVVQTRHPSVLDLILNTAGGIVGLGTIYLVNLNILSSPVKQTT